MSVTRKKENKMCRLCLSSNVAMIDIFCFSSKLGDLPSNVIMKCAPVQITRCDEMPDSICRVCYTQLEKNHQFQLQVVQSDKTLRRYLQNLHTSDSQVAPECFNEGLSGNPLIHDSNITVKCESIELHDVFNVNVNWEENEVFNSANKNAEEIKFEIKDEPVDDPLSKDDGNEISGQDFMIDIGDIKIGEDIIDNWTENQINEEVLFEIKSKATDYNSIFITEHVDNTGNVSCNGDGSEINCEDTYIDIGHTSEITETVKEADKTNSKLYQCDVCDMCFTKLGDFKKHKQWHSKQKTFICAVCNKGFTKPSHLIIHERIHTGEKPYQCDICNKTFSQVSSLNSHKRLHTGKSCASKIKCIDTKKINVGYTSETTEKKEEGPKRNSKLYQCKNCDMCFTKLGDFKSHKRWHSKQKTFVCAVCNKGFTKSGHLIIHERIHTGEKPYQCEVCNKSFSHGGNLNTHYRVHTGDSYGRKIMCVDTKKISVDHTSEITEKKEEGPKINSKLYQCKICDMSFTKIGGFKRHRRWHSKQKAFICAVCNKSFTKSRNLIIHERVHTGEKPYQCEVCNKCFSQEGNLNIHKRLHTGDSSGRKIKCVDTKKINVDYTSEITEKIKDDYKIDLKLYRCKICDTYSQLGDFKRHMLIHFKQKTFTCDVCNSSFKKARRLINHKRGHTGEKPYSCYVCYASFDSTSNLRSHKRTHTGEKPYECAICHKSFAQTNALNIHKLTHTGEKAYQ